MLFLFSFRLCVVALLWPCLLPHLLCWTLCTGDRGHYLLYAVLSTANNGYANVDQLAQLQIVINNLFKNFFGFVFLDAKLHHTADSVFFVISWQGNKRLCINVAVNNGFLNTQQHSLKLHFSFSCLI